MEINRRVWNLIGVIGSGGFGRVFVAQSGSVEAVIKLVPKDPGARRELLFADDLRGMANIIPVIDCGETADSWALVMPRAEGSLRQFLTDRGRPLDRTEALPILIDIARALVNLAERRVVHRDLKPENILYLQGRWCLTDFGISRYADATTASDTRKYSMTRHYAAPEQWREETATSATDVYAFGVIAYELLIGSRPFNGPNFRHQHLHEDPPAVAGIVEPLGALVEDCLIKAPGARPTPSNLLIRLENLAAAKPTTGGLAALQMANRATTAVRAQMARLESEKRSESDRRTALFDVARRQYSRIELTLREAIMSAAPSVRTVLNDGSVRTVLHDGSVKQNPLIECNLYLDRGALCFWRLIQTESVPQVPFDVIAHTVVAVAQTSGDQEGLAKRTRISLRYLRQASYAGRAHSLWFCDAKKKGEYCWFETAFMKTGITSDYINTTYDNTATLNCHSGIYFDSAAFMGVYSDIAFAPEQTEAASALGPSVAEHQVAWPFTPLVPSELDDFIDRWAGWFADASQGQLQFPRRMPEINPNGSWRKS